MGRYIQAFFVNVCIKLTICGAVKSNNYIIYCDSIKKNHSMHTRHVSQSVYGDIVMFPNSFAYFYNYNI